MDQEERTSHAVVAGLANCRDRPVKELVAQVAIGRLAAG